MSKLYSIQESTLTNIGNALRSKYGETRPGTIQVPYVIAKSSNVTDLNNYGFMPTGKTYNVVRIPGATKIKVDLYYMTSSEGFGKVYVASGEYGSNIPTDIMYAGQSSPTLVELEFDNTEVITFCLDAMYIQALGYYAECIGYNIDGNPIEVEGCSYKEQEIEVKNTYSSAEVAAAIEGLSTTPEPIVLTGDYRYACSGALANNYIKLFGNTISTENITIADHMFANNEITNIPFDINFDTNNSHNINNMFYNCANLEVLPKIYNANPSNLTGLFRSAKKLREIPEDYFNTWNFKFLPTQTSVYSGNASYLFYNCYSLRFFPLGWLQNMNPKANYSYCYFYFGFTNCYSLDELVELPIPYTGNWTSNALYYSFNYCCRLKNIIFETNTPKIVNWKNQVIDLTIAVGYFSGLSEKEQMLNLNSGITADKEVTDVTTYQALKDDPDWFTTNIAYSRYNHDSAVATINSLPDASAYLTANGGTNTIKFYGASGSATDGGAINTLTEEEIAVAAAKGWTVTLV